LAAEPVPGAPNRALRRFRRLVGAAILATFLLIVVGTVVRVRDAGLGCGPAGSGVQGWPLCGGRLVPTEQVHTVLEYTHRFLAALVVILLAAILWQALRHLRSERLLVPGAAAAMLLVVAQAVLGGLTVEHGLDTVLVAAHLGMAMLLLAVLLGLLAATGSRRSIGRPDLRPLLGAAVVACVLLLTAIVTGGVVAGTQGHGAPGGKPDEGAHLACGQEFPTCNGSLLPLGSGEMVDIQLIHRMAMLLAVAAIAALALLLRRRGALGRLPIAIAAVLTVQVLLGAANVWVGEDSALVVAHLAVGALLWVLVAAAAATLASSSASWPRISD
jgi:cytochrome c oxidase assembly protein subunit 15